MILLLAWILLLCISSGYCGNGICPSPGKAPAGTSCNPAYYNCNFFKVIITDYKGKLEPLYVKIRSKQELSPEDVEYGNKIVIEYYTELINAGIRYGELAMSVVKNEGNYGVIANAHLAKSIIREIPGATDKDVERITINLRFALAYQDATLRIVCPELPYSAIAKYHFVELAAEGLPPEAWGGALFETFGGSGSYMNMAGLDITIPLDLERVWRALRDKETTDGVDARKALEAIGSTVWAEPCASVSALFKFVLRAFKYSPRGRFYALPVDDSHDLEEYDVAQTH